MHDWHRAAVGRMGRAVSFSPTMPAEQRQYRPERRCRHGGSRRLLPHPILPLAIRRRWGGRRSATSRRVAAEGAVALTTTVRSCRRPGRACAPAQLCAATAPRLVPTASADGRCARSPARSQTNHSTKKELAIQAALALDTIHRGGMSELRMRCLRLLSQATSLGRSISHCTRLLRVCKPSPALERRVLARTSCWRPLL
jgi:hypothetical protein